PDPSSPYVPPLCPPCSRAPLFIFSLTLRPPPRSTLFPYTTLFRSERAIAERHVPLVSRPRVHIPPRPRRAPGAGAPDDARRGRGDRKSTRLNSSHQIISYAVFCLKKKKK